jgi:hypothetical protein
VTPDELLRWEHDRLQTMLCDLARRNGGTLTFSQERIFHAAPVLFEFTLDDDTCSITMHVHELAEPAPNESGDPR